MPLDSLKLILLAVLLTFPLSSKFFYKSSIFLGLDPTLSFMGAAVALWEREEGSSQDKVSLLYSLHSLDSLDINI